MTARRCARLGAIAALAALALAACTTIPSSGPVNEGDGVVSSAGPAVPIAEGPRLDDSPTAIVNGFVTASSAGFAKDFSVARQFLTPEAAATWDPNARVTVFDSGTLAATFDSSASAVTYDIPVQATLDDAGRLAEAADGTRETLTFEMALNEDGQWRISKLDDGTILASAFFERLFTPVNLVFASVDETTQVSELRWLPQNKAVTLAARELVEGPSDWLAPAVHTGFPAASALEVDSVVVTDGVAAVQLTAGSAGTAAQRSLAQDQMELTLTSIPGVRSVKVTVAGLPLAGGDPVDLAPAPLPGEQAVALVGGRLGLWDGTSLWQTPDAIGALPQGSARLAQGFADSRAVWVVGGSSLETSTALAGGTKGLVKATDAAPPPSAMKTDVLYQGAHLVTPSADRHGWFWTADGSQGGVFVAVKPGGRPTSIAVDWLRGATVQALSISRDGARLAVLSRAGGTQQLDVASIVRADDGTPLTVGQPVPVGVDLRPAIDVDWIDDLHVAVLGEAAPDTANDLWLVEVGGLTVATKAVTGATRITARAGERSLLVVDTDGQVFARSGTVWTKVASGVGELAFSG